MNKKTLGAHHLTIVLGACLVLLIAVFGGGFYIAQLKLKTFAQETGKLTEEAAMSQQNIAALRKQEKALDLLASTQKKAEQIVAESRQYQYQNEIILDLTKIAERSGVTITSFTFTDTAASNASNTPSPTSSAATGVTGTATPSQSATPLKSKTVTVDFKSPLSYTKLLNFVYAIEQNATKMQIATLNIAHGDSADEVTTQSFQIEVYVK